MGTGGISVRSGRYLLPLGLIVVAGAVLRIVQLDQSLEADELWTYLEATRYDFRGMLDYVGGIQEITPPLFTILTWLAAHVSESREVVRIPAVAAGILTIPVVFAIGDRTVGRRPALLAAALTALSPMLVWYSVELRAYSLAVLLTTTSTLCMLLAVERRATGWWVAYTGLVAAAMYTHYTVAYFLAAQLVWVLVFRPSARRPALLATIAAALIFLPWLPELRDDLNAPGQDIFNKIAPFGIHNVVQTTTEIVFGLPLALRPFYGIVPIVLFAIGVVVAAGGAAVGWRWRPDPRPAGDVALPVMLALSPLVGAALVSLIGDDQFIPRNVITAVPGILLVLAALVMAGPILTRVVSGVLVVGVFAFGAVRTLEPRFQRIDFEAAAALVDDEARPGDVIVDAPGGYVGGVGGQPLLPAAYALNVALDQPHHVVHAVDPATMRAAVAAAAGGRIFLVGPAPLLDLLSPESLGLEPEPVVQQEFPGIVPLGVRAYEVSPSAAAQSK
jgi:4-amino-4-deoxy-L-arabinose transferase-like glycosyltransferase